MTGIRPDEGSGEHETVTETVKSENLINEQENRNDRGKEEQVIIVRRSHGLASLKLKELWECRELMYFLAWRDVKLRYKQTILGASWAILQPFLAMLLFTLIFNKLIGLSSEGIPYPLFSYSGLVIWMFFANSVMQASDSLVNQANTVKKVYFPRMVIPIAAVGCNALDFVLGFLVLIGMMVYYGFSPGLAVLMLPLFLILALITALGVGLWLSALNVLFRDVRYVVPFMIQMWLFASPIAYSSSFMAERNPIWNYVYGINPMAGIINGFRWSLLGTEVQQPQVILISSLVAVVLLVSGAYFFKRTERVFADVL